jgi:hypothetical protein
MRVLFVFASFLVATCIFANTDIVGHSTEYRGTFSEVVSTGGVCDEVFALAAYDTKHFRVGSNGYTSVLYFAKGEVVGFFSEMSITGRYGYDNQIYAEKELSRGDYTYHMVSEGMVDQQLLLVDLAVAVYDSKTQMYVCETKARYFGQRI